MALAGGRLTADGRMGTGLVPSKDNPVLEEPGKTRTDAAAVSSIAKSPEPPIS